MKRSKAYVYVLILAVVVLGVYRTACFAVGAGVLLPDGKQPDSRGVPAGVWSLLRNGGRPDSDYVPAARVLYLHDDETKALAEKLRWEAAPLPRGTGRMVGFDLSESGELLVAFTGGRIAVYGEDLQVLASFRFSAKEYYVQWYGESIRLVLPREEAVLDFTAEGELLRGLELSSYYPQNQDYIKALKAKNLCPTEEGGYRLENGFWRDRFFNGTYARLVEERGGKRRILLEAGR